MHAPARSRSGFTLIELTAAILLFFIIVTFAYWAMGSSVDQSIRAETGRELRMLAERKLGEVAVFERFYDEQLGPEEFDDLPEEMRERYKDWTWQTDVRDVTVVGDQKDENAPPLYGEASDSATETKDESSSGTGGTAAKKGETQLLREIVLKVTAPGGDGGDGDSIEIVTYLPQVPAKAAAGPKPAGGE